MLVADLEVASIPSGGLPDVTVNLIFTDAMEVSPSNPLFCGPISDQAAKPIRLMVRYATGIEFTAPISFALKLVFRKD